MSDYYYKDLAMNNGWSFNDNTIVPEQPPPKKDDESSLSSIRSSDYASDSEDSSECKRLTEATTKAEEKLEKAIEDGKDPDTIATLEHKIDVCNEKEHERTVNDRWPRFWKNKRDKHNCKKNQEEKTANAVTNVTKKTKRNDSTEDLNVKKKTKKFRALSSTADAIVKPEILPKPNDDDDKKPAAL